MPGILVPITLFIMIPLGIVGGMLVKALSAKWERDSHQRLPPEVAARLERMEQAIDAVAVEVERIAEGQRFTTKLLSERAPAQSVLAQENTHARR